VLAIGAAVANLDVRYGSDGLVVRTGWTHGEASQAGITPVDWKAQAEQLDRRLRDLEQARSQQSVVRTASASDLSDAELLQRMRDIAGQSETRVQRVTGARLTELMHEVDAQRRLDLTTIDQRMTRLQNSSSLTKDIVQRLSASALVRTAYDAK